MKALGAPRASLLGLPAVQLSCSDFRTLRSISAPQSRAAAPVKRGRALNWTHRHFLQGTIQGKLLRGAPIRQDSSPANRGLQTSLVLVFLLVSMFRQLRKFK